MNLFLLLFMTSVGWSHENTTFTIGPANTSVEENRSMQSPGLKQFVDRVISDKSIDMSITNIAKKPDTAAMFHMEGATDNNQSVSVLLKALEAAPQAQKVYLVSTEKADVNGQQRQVFVMTMEYGA